MHIILQNTAAIKGFMELYGDVTNVSRLWNRMRYSINTHYHCRLNRI